MQVYVVVAHAASLEKEQSGEQDQENSIKQFIKAFKNKKIAS